MAAQRDNPLVEIEAEIAPHFGCCMDTWVVEQRIVLTALASVLMGEQDEHQTDLNRELEELDGTRLGGP